MYRGEIKVQDEDIHSLLALAEHLQVKGLCNVRVKTGLGRSEQEKPNREPYRPIKRRKTNSGVSGPQLFVKKTCFSCSSCHFICDLNI